MGRTLYEKIWATHEVASGPGGRSLLYVDRHLIHDGSFHAFEALKAGGRQVRRPDACFATPDHYVPTRGRKRVADIADPMVRGKMEMLAANTAGSGIVHYGMDDPRQGIVHVIGPEQGITQPGITLVCGDSHTSTHGAFGAMAFGIGASEVAHVLATQTLWARRAKTLRITVNGALRPGVHSKDIILAVIAKIGADGGAGHALEYAGSAIRALSMEARLTICNMSIEAGARCGMIAPDDTTFAYLEGRLRAPRGDAWHEAVARWRELPTDAGARFDTSVNIDAATLEPMITYGTNPGMVVPISATIPSRAGDPVFDKALAYMGLTAGEPIQNQPVNVVFLGSCTNGRISDLRAAASVLRGRKVAKGVHLLIVPGSQQVKREAEKEGLDRVFREAGADWRESGCSMCLGMNGDTVPKGEYCVSTSNRNFEGRQGVGARTLLASPLTAAATAIRGRVTDPRDLLNG